VTVIPISLAKPTTFAAKVPGDWVNKYGALTTSHTATPAPVSLLKNVLL
jgi:hypothetical protein